MINELHNFDIVLKHFFKSLFSIQIQSQMENIKKQEKGFLKPESKLSFLD